MRISAPGHFETVLVRLAVGTAFAALLIGLSGSPAQAAVAPVLTVSPVTFNYGLQPVGSSTSQTFTFTNNGASALHPNSTSFGSAGPWNFGSNACFTLGAAGLAGGASCTADVAFSPSGLGPAGTTYTLATSEGASATATLSGSGTAALAIVASPVPQTVADGAGVDFSVTVAGTAPFTVSWESSLTNGATFQPVPASTTVLGAPPYTATLHVDADAKLNGILYRAVVTNSAGTARSAAARLLVIPSVRATCPRPGYVGPSGTTMPDVRVPAPGAPLSCAVGFYGLSLSTGGGGFRATTPIGLDGSTFTYDSRGRLVAVTDPGGAVRSRPTNGAHLSHVTDRAGAGTTFAYDAAGRVSAVSDSLGRVTTYTYDAAGDLTQASDSTGRVTTFTYDAADRLVGSSDTLGRTTTYGYDSARRLTTSSDDAGHVTQYAYDSLGRLTRQMDPGGVPTTYAYDAASRLTAVSEPTGRVTTYAYDSRDRPTRQTDPDGAVTTYTYDAAGRMTSTTAPSGSATTYTYDLLNRLAGQTDGLGRTITYGYDAGGRLVSDTSADGTRATAYALRLPPVFQLPRFIHLAVHSALSLARLWFQATATGDGGALPVECDTSSGSLVSVGNTRVTCTTTAGGAGTFTSFFDVFAEVSIPAIDSGPPPQSTSQGARFDFGVGDGTRSACSLDDAPYAPCSSPRLYRGLAAGPHSLCVAALVGGAVTGSSACQSWSIVSPGPPHTTITSLSVSGSNASVSFFSPDQTGSHFECSLDGGGFRPCTSGITWHGLAGTAAKPGSHTISVRAINFTGEVGPEVSTGAFFTPSP